MYVLESLTFQNYYDILNEFLVSKEIVVLCQWEGSKQKFGFIKRVDKGRITAVKDLESSHEGLTLETSAF